MAFSFGGISTTSSKKLKDQISNNILLHEEYQPGEPYALVLVDKHEENRRVKSMVSFIKKSFTSFRIVLASSIPPTEANIKGGISNFFKNNKTAFEQYLEDECVILTFGAALYAISHDDLQVNYFYDIVTNPNSYFFDPKTCKYVFPMDSFSQILTYGQTLMPVWETYKTNFARYQLQLAVRKYTELSQDTSPDTVHLIELKTTEQVNDVLKAHKRFSHIAWDLETSGFSHFRDKIGVITFSFDGVTGYIAPWEIIDKNILNDFFKTKKQIGANLKFDVKFLWRNGVSNARIDEDTLQLGHILNEMRSNSLKTHAYLYTKHGGYESELDDFKSNTNIQDYTKIPFNVLARYATMDAIVTFQVWKKQQEQLAWIDKTFPNEKNSWYTLTSYYEDIMMTSLRAFAKMEYGGMYISMDRLRSARKTLQEKIQTLEGELRTSLGIIGNFDFNSLPTLGVKLQELGWKNHGLSKTGVYLTGEDQLERWAIEGHREAKLLQELRSTNSLLNTFIGKHDSDGWGKHINHYEDGSYRMCANFSHMLADSGRSKCREPNLQQIPANDELIPAVIDVPSRDYVMFSLDYASLQVRLAGIDARDEMLRKVYSDKKIDGDFHSVTGFPILAEGKKFIKVRLENGVQVQYSSTDKVSVIRDGSAIVIDAGDLLESDDLTV